MSSHIQFVILNTLYETFELEGTTPWINTKDVENNADLNYLGIIPVRREINYLAEKKILMGASGNGHSPFTQVKLNGEGLDIIRFIIKDFPNFLENKNDDDCQKLYKQLSAMVNERGKRLEIYAFVKSHSKDFEQYLEKTDALSSNPTPFNRSELKGNIFMNTGDVYQNISNSTIINRSSFDNAFNKFGNDKEKKDALTDLEDIVNESGNEAIVLLFNNFTEELSKPAPSKSLLKSIGNAIEKVLPTVNSVSLLFSKIIG